MLDHRQAAAADAGDPSAFDRIELVAVVASSGGITLGIAIFVLAGTVAFAIQGRRREIALIRAIGATPSQVRRMLLVETALIGLAAGVAGCLAAGALAGWFTRALVSVGIAPDGFSVTPMWIPYAIAIGASGVVALLATVVAAHRALAIRPGEALAEAALPDRRMGIIRAILGLIALGGGIALVVVLSAHALSYATLAAFCFMIAVVLLGPVVIGWPTALAGQALRATGGTRVPRRRGAAHRPLPRRRGRRRDRAGRGAGRGPGAQSRHGPTSDRARHRAARPRRPGARLAGGWRDCLRRSRRRPRGSRGSRPPRASRPRCTCSIVT